MIPIKGRVTDLALGITLPEREPLRAARKIYDYLVDTMKYNYLAPGAGKGNAVWACDSKTGDCTDFHSVFIGVCRWRGIPADHVFGLPFPPEQPRAMRSIAMLAQFWWPMSGLGSHRRLGAAISSRRTATTISERLEVRGSRWPRPRRHSGAAATGPPLNMLHGPVAEVMARHSRDFHWVAHYKDQTKAAAK